MPRRSRGLPSCGSPRDGTRRRRAFGGICGPSQRAARAIAAIQLGATEPGAAAAVLARRLREAEEESLEGAALPSCSSRLRSRRERSPMRPRAPSGLRSSPLGSTRSSSRRAPSAPSVAPAPRQARRRGCAARDGARGVPPTRHAFRSRQDPSADCDARSPRVSARRPSPRLAPPSPPSRSSAPTVVPTPPPRCCDRSASRPRAAGRKGVGLLTKRELEVLELLGEGLVEPCDRRAPVHQPQDRRAPRRQRALEARAGQPQRGNRLRRPPPLLAARFRHEIGELPDARGLVGRHARRDPSTERGPEGEGDGTAEDRRARGGDRRERCGPARRPRPRGRLRAGDDRRARRAAPVGEGRKAVPQGRHAHVMLASGLAAIEAASPRGHRGAAGGGARPCTSCGRSAW